jgi:alkylated DNA repair dioxygenase AlkB
MKLDPQCSVDHCIFLRAGEQRKLLDELVHCAFVSIGKRKVCHFGTVAYGYNHIVHQVNLNIPPELSNLWSSVEAFTRKSFNSCLVTLYHNGSSFILFHQDNEYCLGQDPFIAYVSLGATRSFFLRECLTNRQIQIPLLSGTLIIMRGATQRLWQHSVPIEPCEALRINITFRCVECC